MDLDLNKLAAVCEAATPGKRRVMPGNWRGETDSRNIYVDVGRHFDHEDGCDCECDGTDGEYCTCYDGCGWAATSFCVFPTNPTAGDIQRNHAEQVAAFDRETCLDLIARARRLEAAEKALADLRVTLADILSNCGCQEDVEPCSNCKRAEAALAALLPTTEVPRG